MKPLSGCGCPPNETHGDACPVIREFRMTPAQRREAYQRELQAAQAHRGQDGAEDVFYRLQKLGVPYDYVQALRRPQDNRSMDGAKRFLQAPREACRCLMLVGPRGVGKSTAAAAVLADFVKRYDWNAQAGGGKQLPPFLWRHADELTRETDFGRVNPDFLEGMRRCNLLVLDEVGHEGTVPGLAALRDVLVYRYEKLRPTVLTSNLAPTEFSERYGESWYTRLRVGAMVPDLRGEKSLRRKGAA